MSTSALLRTTCLALALIAASALPVPAGPASGPSTPTPPARPEAPPAADKKSSLEDMPLPARTVLAVVDSMADALKRVPKGVILTPEEYRAYQDEIARLRKLLEKPRPVPPTSCTLKGKVEGGLVLLQASFEFNTDRPGVLVGLGCAPAQASSASLDGKVPSLQGGRKGTGGEESFSVQVDSAGNHTLTLDLMLPLNGPATRAGTRGDTEGFSLELPRSVITKLDLDLPAGARDVQYNGKDLPLTILRARGNKVAGDVGAAERLELTWKVAREGGKEQVVTADAAVTVKLAATLTTEATLTLKPSSGAVKEWRLHVPQRAEVKAVPADEVRVARIETDPRDGSLRIVRLREASTEPLGLIVSLRSSRPKPGAHLSVGPFLVQGAVRQSVSILVSNSTSDLHLVCTPTPGSGVVPVVAGPAERDNPSLVAAFGSGGAPEGKARTQPWLDIEVQPVFGQLKTRASHVLELISDEVGRRWRVTTTLLVTPRQADVERLQVRLPPGCDCADPERPGLNLPDKKVRFASYDRASRTVEFRLAHGAADTALKPFSVSVEGLYPHLEGDRSAPGKAVLALPRAVSTVEEAGGEVAVRVPADVEVLAPAGSPARGGEGLDLIRQSTHEQVYRSGSRAPERVEVAWRAWRPEIRVTSVVDLTLGEGQGTVRHELRFQLPPGFAAPIVLRVPAAVRGSLRVVSGGQLRSESGPTRQVHLTAGETTLVLEYGFVPEKTRPGETSEALRIPLVVPEQGTQGETRVRIWAGPDLLPVLDTRGADVTLQPGGWLEQGTEDVPGRASLPTLVLRAERLDLPLTLRLRESNPKFSVLLERALVRVRLGPDGVQYYRAGYRLARVAGRTVDVEFPAPVATLGLEVTLGGKKIIPQVREDEKAEVRGRVARLSLGGQAVPLPAVLEISYQLAPGRVGGSTLQTPLVPPVIEGTPEGFPVRWQVTAPAHWVVLGPEGGPGAERTWGRRGWLLGPRPAASAADLEAWLAGPEAEVEEGAGEGPVSFVCWREGREGVTLLHVPQQAWLLFCSLGLLLLGLGLVWLSWPRPGRASALVSAWLWLVLGAGGLMLALAALLWPTFLSQLAYGCEPGAAVFLAVAGVQWLLHERYRRQLVFLPSFSRARGSSLMRSDSASRPHGEPSTVDAPVPAGSSVERRGATP